MNRHSFLWPVAADNIKKVVNGIPRTTYWDPNENGAPSFHPELHYRRPTGEFLKDKKGEFILDANGEQIPLVDVLHCWLFLRIPATPVPHCGTSRGTDGRWDVFQMLPRFIEHADGTVTAPRALGTRIMNRLGRFLTRHQDLNENAAGESWAGMPMSFKEAFERYPGAANRYLKPQHPVEGGDEGETEPIPGSEVQLSPVPGGMDPVVGASIDYRPTAQQCEDDDDMPDEMWPQSEA